MPTEEQLIERGKKVIELFREAKRKLESGELNQDDIDDDSIGAAPLEEQDDLDLTNSL